MTAAEIKANELIKKFRLEIETNMHFNSTIQIDRSAKACAIIAVEEILNEQVRVDYLTEAGYREQKQFWNEVLTHLKSN